MSYSDSTAIGNAARLLEERTSILFSVLGALSGVGLIAMMMITVLDAIGRRFFEFTIYGAYEGGSFLLSGVFFFSLCYCTAKRGHFSIDVVTSRFSQRIRHFINTPRLFANMLDTLLSARGSCNEVKGLQSYGCTINICTHIHTCIGGRLLFVGDRLGVFCANHGLSGKSAGTK